MKSRLEPSTYFPDEAELAELILGRGRAMMWRGLAEVLERHGLPRINPMMGGRYWPAVKKWLDAENGIATIQAGELGPRDGEEKCLEARRPRKKSTHTERQGSAGDSAKTEILQFTGPRSVS